MKRILFIGHEAGRSGAPLVLLHFLRWLRENKPQYRIDLLLLRGGELEAEYRKLTGVYVFPESDNQQIFKRGLEHLKKKLKIKTRHEIPKLAPFSQTYELVVGNTLISLEYLKFFKLERGIATICWLHELEYVVKLFSKEKFIEVSHYADRFIVVSKAVENMLRQFKIEKKTHLVYEFSKTDPQVNENVEAVRAELGIPPDAFVVGGSGTVEWRKGVDWFLQLASRLTARQPDFYFVWVGGKSAHSDLEFNQIEHDFLRLDLKERVIFTGVQKNPHKFFRALDLFALTSREDPFPLACLEAASLGKPIICFEKAGGMPEFVEDDAGAVVPYGDLEAFGEKIIYFYENPEELEKAGQAAHEKVNTAFSLEKSCAALEKILSEAVQ
jgi:glycosyltransferase involved in cell wall biosynthesis